jgi:general secretion pathway protein D
VLDRIQLSPFRNGRSVAGLLAVLVIGLLQAPAPCFAASPPAPKSAQYTFAFHDAEVSQAAEAILGQALHISYSVDPAVTAKISFSIDQKLTGPQLLESFEAALETVDVVLVREGESLVLKPRAKAKGASSIGDLKTAVRGAGYQTVAIPVQYAAPSEVAKALQSITTSDLVVYVDDKQGLLVLGGTASELEAAVQVVKLVDHSGLEDTRIRFFELQEAPASTVYDDLQKIIEASHVSGLTIVPLRRLNGLFVFARTSQALDEVARWVSRLDVPSTEKTSSLWVYHPKNLSADALAAALNGMGGTGGPSASAGSFGGASSQNAYFPGAPGLMTGGSAPTSIQVAVAPSVAASSASAGAGGSMNQVASLLSTPDDPVKVAVDSQSNSLVFAASQGRWVQIQKVLRELDHAPGQVLIQASILEVTLTDHLDLGVEWSYTNPSATTTIASLNTASGGITPKFPGIAAAYVDKNIQAEISALRDKTAVEVVSEPKIMALDNHSAKLQVGDQVPIISQIGQSTNSAGAPIINSVNYESTGVILDVTPRISGDNRIYLDISQQVSSVAATTSSNINSPTIQQRALSTTLLIENGGVVALGGLISSNKTKGVTGAPYLSDIPVLGQLFRTNHNATDKTELIVLISARVIDGAAGSQKAVADLLADMKEIRSRGLLPN